MKNLIQKHMTTYGGAPTRDIILQDDDFKCMSDYIMHSRYIASNSKTQPDPVSIERFEIAKTMIAVMKVISKAPQISLYNPHITINHEEQKVNVWCNIRYSGSDCPPEYDRIIKAEYIYQPDPCYKVTIINRSTLEVPEISLYFKTFVESILLDNTMADISIFAYDMNFPNPSELRHLVVTKYNEVISKYMDDKISK